MAAPLPGPCHLCRATEWAGKRGAGGQGWGRKQEGPLPRSSAQCWEQPGLPGATLAR